MCLDLCPPVYFQFSCHVCFQVSDTWYLIAMSDEYFDVQKSKAISFGQNAFLFLTSSLTRILSQISFFVRKKRIIKGCLPETIVNHWPPKLEKKKNNPGLPGTIDGDGENFQRPSPFHRCRKTTIAIPSP